MCRRQYHETHRRNRGTTTSDGSTTADCRQGAHEDPLRSSHGTLRPTTSRVVPGCMRYEMDLDV
eukprot:5943423-Prorocentrum_lima.AAC.1